MSSFNKVHRYFLLGFCIVALYVIFFDDIRREKIKKEDIKRQKYLNYIDSLANRAVYIDSVSK